MILAVGVRKPHFMFKFFLWYICRILYLRKTLKGIFVRTTEPLHPKIDFSSVKIRLFGQILLLSSLNLPDCIWILDILWEKKTLTLISNSTKKAPRGCLERCPYSLLNRKLLRRSVWPIFYGWILCIEPGEVDFYSWGTETWFRFLIDKAVTY